MGLRKVYDAVDEFMALTTRDILQNEGIPVLLKQNEIAGLQMNMVMVTMMKKSLFSSIRHTFHICRQCCDSISIAPRSITVIFKMPIW